MFYNGLRLEFKKELILHNMESVKEMFLLALELESSIRAPLNRSTFKIKKWCSTCEGYGHNSYECPSIKCSKCENLDIMITSVPRRVNILIICKLMTLIIRGLSRMSTFLLRLLNDVVDELVKSSTPTLDETHIHEESISDVHDALVKSNTPALDETHVHEESISNVHDALVESSTPSHGVMCSLSAPKSLGCLPIVC